MLSVHLPCKEIPEHGGLSLLPLFLGHLLALEELLRDLVDEWRGKHMRFRPVLHDDVLRVVYHQLLPSLIALGDGIDAALMPAR